MKQTAIEDVGPTGLDKGKGGKYLILPPDYKRKPPAGYIPLQAYNYQGYALLRSFVEYFRGEKTGEEILFSPARLTLWFDYFNNANLLYPACSELQTCFQGTILQVPGDSRRMQLGVRLEF